MSGARGPAARVREALARLASYFRQSLDARKAADVQRLVKFVADYPERHAGNLVGLTERAIRWHRDRQEEFADVMCRRYGAETPTMAPPIPLPGARSAGSATMRAGSSATSSAPTCSTGANETSSASMPAPPPE